MTLSFRALFVLCLFPFTIYAQKTDKTSVTRDILRQTNVRESVDETVSSLKSQIRGNPLGLPEGQIDAMIGDFEKAYATEILMRDILKTFEKQYEPDFGAAVSDWIEKDQTRKMLDAEKGYYSLQGTRKRVVRMYEMEQDPPAAEREKMVRSLIATTNAKESAVESRALIFRSILSGFGTLGDRNLNTSQIDGIIQNYRMQIQPQVEEELSSQFLIMFYEIDDNILRDYQSFYETKAGKWLSAAISESIHTALQTAAERFSESLKNPTSGK